MIKKTRSRLSSLTLLEIAASAGIAAAALAPAPASAQVPSWTGFYLGAHAGYRWGDANFSSNSYVFDVDGGGGVSPINFPARNQGYHPNGGIFGFQGGYNYQFAPNYLVGIEADWSWGDAKDSQTTGLNVISADSSTFRLNNTSEVKLSWQATIRGRLGYVAGPWLLYTTGGVAFARVEWTDTNTVLSGVTPIATATTSASKTMTGFVVGAGTEYMFNQNWIGRLEYLYEDFGSVGVSHGFGPQNGDLDVSAHKVRLAISYKFRP